MSTKRQTEVRTRHTLFSPELARLLAQSEVAMAESLVARLEAQETINRAKKLVEQSREYCDRLKKQSGPAC